MSGLEIIDIFLWDEPIIFLRSSTALPVSVNNLFYYDFILFLVCLVCFVKFFFLFNFQATSVAQTMNLKTILLDLQYTVHSHHHPSRQTHMSPIKT